MGAVLLAVSCAACGPPDEPASPPPGRPTSTAAATAPWFTEVAEPAGIDFGQAAGRGGDYSTAEITGSGGALFDYDGDGDLDVYLVDIPRAGDGGETLSSTGNRLFRQDGPERFTDVARSSGAGDPGFGMGALAGDVDNDGDLDLYLSNLGPDTLYLNLGNGVFEAAGPASGLGIDRWSVSACFLDYDRDGALDLYVATYLEFEPTKRCTDSAGNREFCGPEAFRGVPDLLFRGYANGSFTEVSATALPGGPANRGLGVICADLDNDGWTDVYVANDGERNQLWINRGDGTFEERALLLGAALNLFGRPGPAWGWRPAISTAISISTSS